MTAGNAASPSAVFTNGQQQNPLTHVTRSYDPSGFDSRARCGYNAENIGRWIEKATEIRKQY